MSIINSAASIAPNVVYVDLNQLTPVYNANQFKTSSSQVNALVSNSIQTSQANITGTIQPSSTSGVTTQYMETYVANQISALTGVSVPSNLQTLSEIDAAITTLDGQTQNITATSGSTSIAGNTTVTGTGSVLTTPSLSVSSSISLPNASVSGSAIANGDVTQTQVSNGYCDLSSAQTVGGIKTFSSAPVMSGASISSATIAGASLANNAVSQTQVLNGYCDLSSAQ